MLCPMEAARRRGCGARRVRAPLQRQVAQATMMAVRSGSGVFPAAFRASRRGAGAVGGVQPTGVCHLRPWSRCCDCGGAVPRPPCSGSHSPARKTGASFATLAKSRRVRRWSPSAVRRFLSWPSSLPPRCPRTRPEASRWSWFLSP